MNPLVGSTAYDPSYMALVLLTSPYENWIRRRSSLWRHVWRHIVFLGATAWKVILSNDSATHWFTDEDKKWPWLVDVNRIYAAARFLVERPWSGLVGKEWYDFAYGSHDEIARRGHMELWGVYGPSWHEIAKEISLIDFTKSSPEPSEYDDIPDEWIWAALSFFPPGFVPRGGREITLSNVVARNETGAAAELIFLWQETGLLKRIFPESRFPDSPQIAWGICVSRIGGQRWAGKILYNFPALESCVTLYDTPYRGYYASLYTTPVYNEKGAEIDQMGVWAIVATHIPDCSGASMRQVVEDTLAFLCYPQVEKAIREATSGKYYGCQVFVRTEEGWRGGIQKIGEVR